MNSLKSLTADCLQRSSEIYWPHDTRGRGEFTGWWGKEGERVCVCVCLYREIDGCNFSEGYL